MKIIREHSTQRTVWDIFIYLLIISSILIIPFQFALQHKVTLVGSIIVYTLDLFFLIDLFLNSITTYRIAGEEVRDKSTLFQHYLKTSFKTDFLAAVPFDALLLLWPGHEWEGISVVLWLRLLRLVRIRHLFIILSRWHSHHGVNPGYLRIIRLLGIVLMLSHLIACAWYVSCFFAGFPANSWVIVHGIKNSDIATIYIRSLYWTVTTITTVGFGDITPHLNYEYVITTIVMIIGASMYAFVIGNIASLYSKLDIHKVNYWSRIDTIKLYLRYRGISAQLTERVRNYYEYRWAHHRGLEEGVIFDDLSEPLHLEVMMQLTKGLLDKIPLFKYSSSNLKNVLLLALKVKTFDPGSLLVRSGQIGKEIIFISKGKVEIINEAGDKVYCTMKSGEYFGNISIIFGERRTASVRATEFCETFILTSEDFNHIKKEYPEFIEVMKSMSAEPTNKVSQLLVDGVIL